MSFCNSRLLMEIYRSRKLQTERQKQRYCTSKITLILVSIVILYFLCVCPSTTLGFLVETIGRMGDTKTYFGYQIALVIFNLTQAIYFAGNFALYCSVSRPFRDSVGLQLFCKRSTLRSTSEPKNPKADYKLVVMRWHKRHEDHHPSYSSSTGVTTSTSCMLSSHDFYEHPILELT